MLYRGLQKNTARLHLLFALSNLYRARRALLAVAGTRRSCAHAAKSRKTIRKMTSNPSLPPSLFRQKPARLSPG